MRPLLATDTHACKSRVLGLQGCVTSPSCSFILFIFITTTWAWIRCLSVTNSSWTIGNKNAFFNKSIMIICIFLFVWKLSKRWYFDSIYILISFLLTCTLFIKLSFSHSSSDYLEIKKNTLFFIYKLLKKYFCLISLPSETDYLKEFILNS